MAEELMTFLYVNKQRMVFTLKDFVNFDPQTVSYFKAAGLLPDTHTLCLVTANAYAAYRCAPVKTVTGCHSGLEWFC